MEAMRLGSSSIMSSDFCIWLLYHMEIDIVEFGRVSYEGCALLAQLVEQLTLNQLAACSSHAQRTKAPFIF